MQESSAANRGGRVDKMEFRYIKVFGRGRNSGADREITRLGEGWWIGSRPVRADKGQRELGGLGKEGNAA